MSYAIIDMNRRFRRGNAVISEFVVRTSNFFVSGYFMENFKKMIPFGCHRGGFSWSQKFSNRSPYNAAFLKSHVPYIEVKGRSGIRIHVGNYCTESEGCLLVGSGINQDYTMVLNSRTAYCNLMRWFNSHDVTEFYINIRKSGTFDMDINDLEDEEIAELPF